MEKTVYKCECGYTTHFEKALQAHCRFRNHRPAGGTVKIDVHIVGDDIRQDVEKELKKAVKRTTRKKAEAQPTEQTEKKTRKPRAKKTAAKE